jgi:hypothetical protein
LKPKRTFIPRQQYHIPDDGILADFGPMILF